MKKTYNLRTSRPKHSEGHPTQSSVDGHDSMFKAAAGKAIVLAMVVITMVCTQAYFAHRLNTATTYTYPSKSVQQRAPVTGMQSLPSGHCHGSTIVSIVAHEDDDILFENPDIIRHIKTGDCIRTIYLTAGDASLSVRYWQSREYGAEAAYTTMLNDTGSWRYTSVKLADHRVLETAGLSDSDRVTLVFMHLPDGYITGEGYASTGHESLARLHAGKIRAIHSIDKLSEYTASELTDTLTAIIGSYQPKEVYIQTPYNTGRLYRDHSDHVAAGQFASEALRNYRPIATPNVVRYTGYPIHELRSNLSTIDEADKSRVFYAYAKYDSAVCQSAVACSNLPIGAYLSREYTAR